jgi:maleamate amidohydrolase
MAWSVRWRRPSIASARAALVPVIYTKVLFHSSGADGGLFVRKVPALRGLVAGEPLAEIDPSIAPRPEDLVVIKNYPSAFFGTSLFGTSLGPALNVFGIETLVLSGCSTSGCVRATAVDGIQYGYRVIVPRECVGDRHDAPHDSALFDINAKYGDVLGKREVPACLSASHQ